MKHGVLFEINGVKKHSSDFNLWLTPYTIKYPQAKTQFVDVLGMNGSIDLSDVFGRVFYNDRSFTLSFECLDKLRFDDTLNQLVAFLHGQRCKLTIYDNPNYFYDCRLSVNEYTSSKILGNINIDVIAKPFKLKNTLTINKQVVTNGKVVIYKNNRMETTPSFKSDAPVNFEFNNTKYSISSTEPIIFANIEFKQGDNSIKWLGSANVEVSYQEGDF